MKKITTYIIAISAVLTSLYGCNQEKTISISKEVLMDKIKGGWAGQTFGCTYGGPTEFKFNGRIIPDSIEIEWTDGQCQWWFDNDPGLYDDVYMDLTFVEMFEEHGLDVSVDSIANAFAYANYKLWHANQAARYNIINGIPAPQSGHWKNNPHADDIDFQIEADFAGLMSPGMPNTSTEICDKIGHIMCYGDGWYGGVYVAAMYSLAFISDDIKFVVKEALKIIPAESDYHKCISDVIKWSEENEDWKVTWQLFQDEWSDEVGCPKSVKRPVNIDAKVNSAYVVMGLLYGNKNIDKTLEVSTRCGNDSDCNPATAMGILGTMIGYSNIPNKWLNNVRQIENTNFKYTDISLNKTYQMSFNQTLQVIEQNGGKVGDDKVVIKVQQPRTTRYEKCFKGLKVSLRDNMNYTDFRNKPYTYDFEGVGIVLDGRIKGNEKCPENYVAEIEITIDGEKSLQKLPVNFILRKKEVYWNYDLPDGKHNVSMKWLNPVDEATLQLESAIIYTNL